MTGVANNPVGLLLTPPGVEVLRGHSSTQQVFFTTICKTLQLRLVQLQLQQLKASCAISYAGGFWTCNLPAKISIANCPYSAADTDPALKTELFPQTLVCPFWYVQWVHLDCCRNLTLDVLLLWWRWEKANSGRSRLFSLNASPTVTLRQQFKSLLITTGLAEVWKHRAVQILLRKSVWKSKDQVGFGLTDSNIRQIGLNTGCDTEYNVVLLCCCSFPEPPTFLVSFQNKFGMCAS